MGVSAGSNAIQVYEHRASYMPALLSYSGSLILSGWNHIAIVYTAKQPTLYVNGVFAKTGLTSNQNNVFPSCQIGGAGYGYYRGDVDEFRIWSISKTVSEIRDNMCQKLDGNESNLERYYRFDNGSGTTATDATDNNHGTLVNMTPASDWITSAAPIGDESIHSYTVSTATSLNIASVKGDDLTANVASLTTTPSSIHIYRVDAEPNVITPPGTQIQLSEVTYYGVKVFGGSGVNYTVIYNYDGHPGVLDENNLELAKRDHNADLTWSQESAALNTGANTLTLAGQTGTEYILATIGTDPLPIELINFGAIYNEDKVEINWTTATEINNDYFEIQRSDNGFEFETILRVNGAGNSTQLIDYFEVDYNPLPGVSYYRIKQIDYNGDSKSFNIIPVEAMKSNEVSLHLFPNPIQKGNNVSIELQGLKNAEVIVVLRNLTGQEFYSKVKIIQTEKEIHAIPIDGYLPVGVYLVTATSNNSIYSKTLIVK